MVLGAAFWTPVSLAASWWVYDQSPLRRWRFVADGLARVPDRVLLVVAGFDEVSPALVEQWPHARIEVVDVVAEPEASVRRARRWYPADVPVVSPAALAAPGSYDLVLFAQSAHEIRDPAQRAALFGAAQRALTEDGRVVLVEHLRDLANFVAFGPAGGTSPIAAPGSTPSAAPRSTSSVTRGSLRWCTAGRWLAESLG